MFPRIKKTVRRHFLTGLLVFVPMALTVFLLSWIDNSITEVLDKAALWLPKEWEMEKHLPSRIPGVGIVATLFVIYVVGVLSSAYLGRAVVILYEHALQRIPGVRWLYAVAKQMMEAIFRLLEEFQKHGADRFRGVVLIEYPRRDCFTIAFITGDPPEEVVRKTGRDMVNVFVPTTPNPTSGYYLILPRADVIKLDMPVEQAFRLVVSAGMIGSEEAKEPERKKARSKQERASTMVP